MSDAAFIDRIVSGQLQNACRLCLRELLGPGVATLDDVLATSDVEVTLEQHLDETFPELQITSWVSGGLSKKLCFRCLKELKFFQYKPERKRNLIALEHYVNELCESFQKLETHTLADSAKAAVIHVKPLPKDFKPKKFIAKTESFKLQERDYIYFDVQNFKQENADLTSDVDIKEELDTDEFDDTILIVGDEENADDVQNELKMPEFYHKKFIEEKDEKDFRTLHILKNSGKKAPRIQCKMCQKKYATISWLVQHGLNAHGFIICEECEDQFDNEEEYTQHVEEHEVAYSCDLCGRGFKFRHSIVLHLQKHEREKWEACVCEACGAQLWDRTSLEQHVRRAHGGRPRPRLACDHCGRMYRGVGSLEAHLARHRDAGESGTCEECGSIFSSAAALSRHVHMAHSVRSAPLTPNDSGDKIRHPCQTCGRTFVDARALRWHERLHTGERPYHCAECGRDFISRYRRNQHALTAHTAPQRQCPLCPALFHLNSMVNTHIKKVHLRDHKRRSRSKRHDEVCWPTEKVPFSDLSVHVQTQLLRRSIV